MESCLKKISFFLFIVLFSLTFAACGKKTEPSSNEVSSSADVSPTRVPEAPTPTKAAPTSPPATPTKKPEAPTKKPATPTPSPIPDDLNPELLTLLDRYESFFDDYCEFVQEFKTADDAVSRINQYDSYIKQFDSMMEEFEKLPENNDLTYDEKEYCLDVMNRVYNKVAKLTGANDGPTRVPKKSDDEKLVNGMHPEFLDIIDSYQEFFVEYCKFLRKYQNVSEDQIPVEEYMVFMEKYNVAMQKMEQLKTMEMNDAEFAYYEDVLIQINQDIMDASNQ